MTSYSPTEGCVTAWKEIRVSDNRRRYYITVVNGQGENERADAVGIILKAIREDYEPFLQSHRDWWHSYYQQSFVSLPDTRLEAFYWIQMYKLASATRADYKIS